MHRSSRVGRYGVVVLAAVILLVTTACGAPEATDSPSPPTADPTARHVDSEAASIALDIDPAALPDAPLGPDDVLADPCRLAGVEEMKAYFAFLEVPLALRRGERNDRPECIYEAPQHGFEVRVFFDETFRPRSGEEVVTLAGVADVRRRVMARAATVCIPFPEARDSSKRPADRIVISVDLPATGWERSYRAADVQRLIDGLASNLVRRLRSASGE